MVFTEVGESDGGVIGDKWGQVSSIWASGLGHVHHVSILALEFLRGIVGIACGLLARQSSSAAGIIWAAMQVVISMSMIEGHIWGVKSNEMYFSCQMFN